MQDCQSDFLPGTLKDTGIELHKDSNCGEFFCGVKCRCEMIISGDLHN